MSEFNVKENNTAGDEMMDELHEYITNIAMKVYEMMSSAKINVHYKRLTKTAKEPTYATECDTCADLYADEDMVIEPHTVGKISTGLAFEEPDGVYLRILQRSGLASKGIFPVGGVIDNQYRGDVIVALHNSTNDAYRVSKGDKIAQMEVRTFHQMKLEEVTELSDGGNRGINGFGSSDR